MAAAKKTTKTRRKAAPTAPAAPVAPLAPVAAPAPVAEDGTTRRRMVEGAAILLAKRGLQATSFSEVLAATQTPRGSLYHHFPEGKDQLVREALAHVTAQMEAVLATRDGAAAEPIVDLFLRAWRSVLTRSRMQAGCAVVAVTIATDSAELLAAAGAIFRSWRGRLADMLTRSGLAPDTAASFAALLIAATEGAVILSRGEQSMQPFELVATGLLDQVRALVLSARRSPS